MIQDLLPCDCKQLSDLIQLASEYFITETQDLEDSKGSTCSESKGSTGPPAYFQDPNSEKRVLYIDSAGVDWNNPRNTIINAIDAGSNGKGFNVLNFAFFLETGPFDFALVWQQMSAADKKFCLDYAHSRDCALMVSAGGSTVSLSGLDPTIWSNRICDFVIANGLDGVDYDLEGIGPGFTYAGIPDLYAWMKTLNDTTHARLGDSLIITHCPQMPYMSRQNVPGTWPGIQGGYTRVYKDAPYISWLNLQYYNQGNNNYNTYNTVYLTSAPDFPQSAQQQVNLSGVPYNKMVFGTYLLRIDASTGNNDPYFIRDSLTTAQSQFGAPRSTMLWQCHFPSDGSPTMSQWMDIVYPPPLSKFI